MAKSRNLNKKMIPAKATMVVTLLAWFALAQRNAVEFVVGFAWYSTANADCKRLLERVKGYDGVGGAVVDFHAVCQVVAAISPGKEWGANVRDAELVIEAFFAFDSVADRKAYVLSSGHFQVGYCWQNTLNAWDILAGGNIPASREKTFCFAENIEFPLTSERSTVDQHMVHILCETRGRGGINPGSHYGKLEVAIVEAAALLGVRPLELQAAVWHERVSRFASGYDVSSLYALLESVEVVEGA